MFHFFSGRGGVISSDGWRAPIGNSSGFQAGLMKDKDHVILSSILRFKKYANEASARYYSLNKNNRVGDFRFVVIEKNISNENELGMFEKIVPNIYSFLRLFALPEDRAFGLDTGNVTVEKVPLVVSLSKKAI